MKYILLCLLLIGCSFIGANKTSYLSLDTYTLNTIPIIKSNITNREVTQKDINRFKIIHENTKYNFTYITDNEQYGVRDYWELKDYTKPFKGDCDEFALAIKDQLDKENIPSRFIYGKYLRGGWHIGILVGNYISDNSMYYISSFDSTKRFIKWYYVSDYTTTELWRKIN